MKVRKADRDRAYLNLGEEARFREQLRIGIEIAIIATIFVIPTGNVLMVYLKWVVGFSALFASLYLVFTAATLKYSDPRELYNVFRISERVRMKAYDLSIDVYAIGLLFFLAILITGIVQKVFTVKFDDAKASIFVALTSLLVGIIFLIINVLLQKYSKKKGRLDSKI